MNSGRSVGKAALAVIVLALPLPFLAQQAGLNEGFASWPPQGWTLTAATACGGWQSSSSLGLPNYTGGSGPCAMASSAACDAGADLSLISPAIAIAPGAAAPTLTFKQDLFLGTYGSDSAEVDVSGDGGQSWTSVAYFTGTGGVRGPDIQSIDLSPYMGSTIQIRFHYMAGGPDWWWQVDDVVVTGGGSPPPPPPPPTTYNLYFQDDFGRSSLCADSSTGAWSYTVLKGNGAGSSFAGQGSIIQGNGFLQIRSLPGASALTLIDYTTAHRATATFVNRSNAIASSLYDSNTQDDGPPACGSGANSVHG
ncbi:MAG: choice-of-anchor J domain-containing protein [Acidobacteriota bacterium]